MVRPCYDPETGELRGLYETIEYLIVRDFPENFSNIYFFLPAITDRSKDINQYLNNVSISPIDITQSQLKDWAGTK